jgi:predicted kinase
VAQQLLYQGQSVILDFGFIRKARREKARRTATGFGFQTQLHVVDADVETRRIRVTLRNSSQGNTYAFAVTPAMFAFAEKMYEAPDEAESEEAITLSS